MGTTISSANHMNTKPTNNSDVPLGTENESYFLIEKKL